MNTLSRSTTEFSNPIRASADDISVSLGEAHPFDDPLARLLLLDNFDYALAGQWLNASDAGGSVTISADTSKSGASSLKLVTPATNNKRAVAQRYIPYAAPGRFGIETSFALLNGNSTVALGLEVQMPGYQIFAVLYMILVAFGSNFANATIQFIDQHAVGQGAPGDKAENIVLATYAWNTMKMVIDVNNDKYVRGIVNNQTFDLSAYSLNHTDEPTQGYLSPILSVVANENVAKTCYFDGLLITQNEA